MTWVYGGNGYVNLNFVATISDENDHGQVTLYNAAGETMGRTSGKCLSDLGGAIIPGTGRALVVSWQEPSDDCPTGLDTATRAVVGWRIVPMVGVCPIVAGAELCPDQVALVLHEDGTVEEVGSCVWWSKADALAGIAAEEPWKRGFRR